MHPRTGTIIFFDLAGFSTAADPAQATMAQSFMDALKAELIGMWGSPPVRSEDSRYLVLPTGDGAAAILWDKAPHHPRREYTALWLAGRMLAWANSQSPAIGVRCGINSGELDFVNDPYGMPNVCGAAINVAQRIMDAARPGQLLVRHETVAQRLSPSEDALRLDFGYHRDVAVYEVLAKHHELLKVQTVTGHVVEAGVRKPFGLAQPPANKWHLQIEPPILRLDAYGMERLKKPPVELLLKHVKMAFVGATNDQLAGMCAEALRDNPSKTWESVTVFLLADEQLRWIATSDRPHKLLLDLKVTAVKDLKDVLTRHARHCEFLEYDRPFYFASYWDWDKPGGRIHVSPYIWGADVRVCPALDYTWVTRDPTPQYRAYLDGLHHLRQLARPIG
ncbi:MAG: hypothetical protein FJ279_13760 [Planctomycetes bacterium]|nr:hypothetical protein [Planctomycetota bacterium]MBM4080583.1 hypothetical protein [Planctomycetota bacterium]